MNEEIDEDRRPLNRWLVVHFIQLVFWKTFLLNQIIFNNFTFFFLPRSPANKLMIGKNNWLRKTYSIAQSLNFLIFLNGKQHYISIFFLLSSWGLKTINSFIPCQLTFSKLFQHRRVFVFTVHSTDWEMKLTPNLFYLRSDTPSSQKKNILSGVRRTWKWNDG